MRSLKELWLQQHDDPKALLLLINKTRRHKLLSLQQEKQESCDAIRLAEIEGYWGCFQSYNLCFLLCNKVLKLCT